ncbi:MAG: hypothetical protein Q4G64_09430 [bacterium]|nr:hypothetical protein [bacterium]
MNRSRDSYTGASWLRVESKDQRDALPPKQRAAMLADLDGVPDSAPVAVRADTLRTLLACQAPPTSTRGASIRNESRGVTYLATVARGTDGVHLRSVEVVPDHVPADPRVWRIPERILTETTAEVLALEAASGDAADSFAWGVDWPDPDRPPSAEELAELVNASVTRHAIAERYGRALNTVDQWLRVARRERPELFPERRRGPKPQPLGSKTPEAQSAPGEERKPKMGNERGGQRE